MKRFIILLAAAITLLTACTVKYSLSGASIPPDAKTFSVAYFPNNAPMVAPILSATLTDELSQRFASRTSLVQVEEGGDFAFEGEIVGYSSTTSSVSSGDYALQNRLTISIKVKFTNAIDDKMSEVEGDLIPQIVEQLVTDIFQAAASNW